MNKVEIEKINQILSSLWKKEDFDGDRVAYNQALQDVQIALDSLEDEPVSKDLGKEIKISQEDYDFLKDLQHELQTQDNDGTADPLYWMVEEEETVGVPDGCGDPIIYVGDGVTMELEEAVKSIEEDYLEDLDEDNKEEWADVYKDDMDDVVRFMNDILGWNEARIVWQKKQNVVSRETGAFITKRACKQYIQNFGYNHTNPHTYAMCAYRNFELARLLKILKTMEL